MGEVAPESGENVLDKNVLLTLVKSGYTANEYTPAMTYFDTDKYSIEERAAYIRSPYIVGTDSSRFSTQNKQLCVTC